jgi:hypothetical protein
VKLKGQQRLYEEQEEKMDVGVGIVELPFFNFNFATSR